MQFKFAKIGNSHIIFNRLTGEHHRHNNPGLLHSGALPRILERVWLSFKFSVPFGDWLKSFADLPGTVLHIIAFALILTIVMLVLTLIGKAIEKVVKLAMLGWLNKLLGIVFALLKAVLIIGLVIIIFDAIYNLIPFVSSDTLNESVLYNPIKSIANTVFPFLKELIFNK